MTRARFIAGPAQEDLVAELGAAAPDNPFATARFFESKARAGLATWVLALRDGAGALECGCGAFLRSGRLNRSLEIVSLPAVATDSPFWDGLREFCRQHAVTSLKLDTFGSPSGVEIPALGSRCTRRGRCEFVLDLAGDLAAKLSSNHKRNVKRADKAGLVVRRTQAVEAVHAHQVLMRQSGDRRRSRGESVGTTGATPEHVGLVRAGAGELFQALQADTVLSSVLVLLAPMGGYYHSAGTSPEGMEVGASHFLIHAIASQLSAAGARTLNLGGAEEESSLARFKRGFGAAPVPLPSASCYIGPSWRRLATEGLALLRSDRSTLLRWLGRGGAT